MKLTRTLCLLVCALITAASASAQYFPFPGKETPVPCTGCPDEFEDLPTWPYDDPLVAHAGRYVDSHRTINAQHAGMRTVRARKIRVSPATGRLYLQLGEAVGGYPLDQYFTTILRRPMSLVSVIKTGSAYNRFGTPLEKIAVPDSFFYVEANTSGWSYELIDHQTHLNDFDADDRGYVYVGTLYFGWGIARDVGIVDAKHMTFVHQNRERSTQPYSVIALRSGDTYYAVVSAPSLGGGADDFYDVTNPAAPQFLTQRSGSSRGIIAWARDDARQRLALISSDRHVRIYDYATFIAGGAPLADFAPPSTKFFIDLAFDESGRLWFTENATASSTGKLWNAVSSGNGYTATSLDLGTYGPGSIAANAGYLAVGRMSNPRELRLYRNDGGTLELLNTNDFFRNYYHSAPDGYAAPGEFNPSYIKQHSVSIIEQAGKTYVIYAAEGLGDVYELQRDLDENRIATSITVTSSPNPSSLAQSVTLTATLTTASAGANPPQGSVTFTIDGIAAATASVSGAASPYTATITRTDLNVGQHAVTASFEGDDHYAPSGPAVHTHRGAQPVPVLTATATGTASVSLSWTALAGYEYDVLRSSNNGAFAVLTRVAGNTYADPNVTAGTTYLYKVQSFEGDTAGPFSNVDPATTIAFTDAGLPYGTIVKAAHMLELRSAANAFRTAVGLAPFAFGPAPAPGVQIDAAHLLELRSAVNEARAVLGFGNVPYFAIHPGVTPVRAFDLTALRNAMQ